MKAVISFIKKNRINIGVILLFLIISIAYFSPVLKGYSLRMGDMKGYNGMAKELLDYYKLNDGQAIWTNSMFGGMPGYLIYFEKVNLINYLHRIVAGFIKYPIEPLFFAMVSFYFLMRVLRVKYVIAILGAIAFGFSTYNFLIIEAGHVTKVLAISFFPFVMGGIFMVYRNKNLWISFGLLAFFFGLEIMVNHVQMTYYFIFVMLGVGVSEFFNFLKKNEIKKYFVRSSIIVIAGILGLVANFANYYFVYKYAEKSMRGKSEITVKPNNLSGQTSLENDKNKSKGLDRDYIVNWSYGKEETYNLLVPYAKGGNAFINDMFKYLNKKNSTYSKFVYEIYQKNGGRAFGGYFGDQPGTSGPNYIGAIVVFLALLYLLWVHKPLKWALFFVSMLAIMLAWGKNLGGSVESMWLTNFFIDYVPMYNKFRAVSSFLVVVNFTLPFMAVLFLKEMVSNGEWFKENSRKILISGVVIASLILVVSMSPTTFFSFTNKVENSVIYNLNQELSKTTSSVNINDIVSEIVEFRVDKFKESSFRTLGFILVALILLGLVSKDKIKVNVAIGVLAALVLFDLWSLNSNYLNNEKLAENKNQYKHWEKSSKGENIPEINEGDLSIYNNELGINPNIAQQVEKRIKDEKLKSRGRLSKRELQSIQFSTLNMNTNYRVLELDNPFNSSRASYFHKSTGGYSPAKLRRYQDIIDFYISKELNFLSTGKLEKMKVLNMLNNKYYLYQGNLLGQNQYAFGNAWFVNQVKFVNSANEEILAIENTDVKNVAIIDSKFNNVIKDKKVVNDPNASIIMISYKPNHISYKSSSVSDQLAVFSEIYYEDGWNAYIDGEKVAHARANYILRALPIPEGEHTVDFKFEPSFVETSFVINVVSFFIMFLALSYGIFLDYKKNTLRTSDTVKEKL